MTRDYAAPDWRGLCEELVAELERYRPLAEVPDCLQRARAALAEPVAEGPTDEELLELAQHHSVSYTLSDGSVVYPLQEGCDMRDDVLSFARAVLARFGHQPAPPAAGEVGVVLRELRDAAFDLNGSDPAKWMLTRAADLLSQRHPAPPAEGDCPACEGVPKPGNQPCAVCGRPVPPPAEGEVAELVAVLRADAECAEVEHYDLCDMTADQMRRAADLLEQRQAAPVPVAERLPGPEDCDAEGRCWVHQPHEACPESPAWELMLAKYASPNYEAVCWLPAHALPLPAGEVQP